MFLSCHVRISEWTTLNSCLNIKEPLARSRRKIWSLSDCNWTQTQNPIVRKRTLNHLAKLTKWLSCVLSIYLYSAFDCISCHVRIRVWIIAQISTQNTAQSFGQFGRMVECLAACNFSNSWYLNLHFSNTINLYPNIWFIKNSTCQQFLFWRKSRQNNTNFSFYKVPLFRNGILYWYECSRVLRHFSVDFRKSVV